MKQLIEDNWLEPPKAEVTNRLLEIRKEIEDAGLQVTYKATLDPLKLKVKAEVTIWVPKKLTIH